MASITITLDELKTRCGEELGLSRWFEICQERVNNFAEITEDHQFIHVDPARAQAETPFGGTIAHGFLTMSLLAAMSYDAKPKINGTAMLVNYGMNRLRFVSPVPTGSRVRGRFVLKEAQENRPGEATLIWDVTVEIHGREKPALIAEWISRLYLESQTA